MLAQSLQKSISQGERLLASRPDEEEQRPHPRRATVSIEIRPRSMRTSIKRHKES
jgi:hypothetical protein